MFLAEKIFTHTCHSQPQPYKEMKMFITVSFKLTQHKDKQYEKSKFLLWQMLRQRKMSDLTSEESSLACLLPYTNNGSLVLM